jgi:thiamine-monophosphate kinase
MSDVLGDVGEIEALARIIPRLPPAPRALLGPGDDAAVLEAHDAVVLTTDVMVEGPDFRRAWSTAQEVGWKAAATNLADIAAMGAVPTGLLIALTAPPGTPVPMLEGIADGIAAACAALAPACGVLGGDLTASPTLTVAVTAVGALDGVDPVRRSGARAGDVVAYAGRLGLAGAALRLLFDAGQDPAALAALRGRSRELLAEQLAPSPPMEAGPAAARAGATAMLDVSDGLLLDASRIARASGVQLDLGSAALAPDVQAVASALGSAAGALELVLTGGEDHGLLACFPEGAALPAGFRVIGEVLAGEAGVLVDGADPQLGRAGWDSFTAR